MFIDAGGSIEYPIVLEEDNWYHICVTYDRSNLRLFLNEAEVSNDFPCNATLINVNDQCEFVIPDYTGSAPIITQSPLAGCITSGENIVQQITISARDKRLPEAISIRDTAVTMEEGQYGGQDPSGIYYYVLNLEKEVMNK